MGMKDKGRRLKEAAEEVMGTEKKEPAAEQPGRVPQNGLKGRCRQEDRQASFDDVRDEVDKR
ncbi:hypothetical protein ACIPRL_36055 [Streptomyces sp. NPDC090085]|uniref:hypothetical protein n=1 Tax=Streptomyces sp. NPDC090085 TaxID=3365943 RepID=UPI00381F46DF